MIESWQILLVAVVTVLTVLLTVIGVQIIYILKEVRETLGRINHLLTKADDLTQVFTNSVSSISGFGAGLRAALKLVSMIKGRSEDKSR